MIELRGLTKRYGGKLAVDRLTFTVLPGRVTRDAVEYRPHEEAAP
jgi:ABC-type multidrug transport system ATPase subunit